MKEGAPSRTAYGAARRRAEHQLFDFPHVFEDPMALRILGPNAIVAIMLGSLNAYLPRVRRLRAFIAARSRYAEDQLVNAVASGTAQYVVLGAGLDTFAYRNSSSGCALRVFEVDHPDTQAWKKRCLAEAAISVPSSLTFVPLDFERQRLGTELKKAGFRLNEPAFFSWLGVTPYLTREAVSATFSLVHSFCPDNAIAFDYARPRQASSGDETIAFDALSARVGRAGEPFRGFFEPEALACDLKTIGFRRVAAPTADQINGLYFRDRLDGLQMGGRLGGLMCAY